MLHNLSEFVARVLVMAASFEFCPVPAGTNALIHRGRQHYVRLLAGAQTGFGGALASVAVDDPNDHGTRVVELSTMEYLMAALSVPT